MPKHAAGELRSVLPTSIAERIDFSSLELLPASFVDAEMAHRHADLLFRAPLDGNPAYLYFLLEHQSEPDALMAFRVLTYVQRIWASLLRDEPGRRTLPVVVPLIIHHGRGGWTAPKSLHALVEGLDTLPALAPLVPGFELLIDDLAGVDDDALLARPLPAFPKVALWALRDARAIESLFSSLGRWARELERVVDEDRDQQDILFLLRYILRVAGGVSFETVRQKFIEVTPVVEAAMASAAEQLIEQGLKQGVQQGLKQGVQQGIREMLARQLELRFGALDPKTQALLAEGDSADLERWLERVLSAETLGAVFAA